MSIVKRSIIVDGAWVAYRFISEVETPTSGSYQIKLSYEVSIPAEEVKVYLEQNQQELPYGFSSRDGQTKVEYRLDSKLVTNPLTRIIIQIRVQSKHLPQGLGQLVYLSGFSETEELEVRHQRLFGTSLPPVTVSEHDGGVTYRFPAKGLLVKDTRKLQLQQNRPLALEFGTRFEATMVQRYGFRLSKADLSKLKLRMRVPRSSSYQQVHPALHPSTGEVTTDEEGNAWAEWEYEGLAAGSAIDFTVTSQVSRLRQIFHETSYGHVRDYPSTAKQYLKVPDRWALGKVPQLLGLTKSKDVYSRIVAVFQFVNNYLSYQITEGRRPARETLRLGSGDCSEYSDLTVALLRKFGIPACYAHGQAIDRDTYQLNGHAWVEFMVPDGTWYAADPTWGSLGGVDAAHILEGCDSASSDDETGHSIQYQVSYKGKSKPQITGDDERFISQLM